jgi:ankyrin repeat protein
MLNINLIEKAVVLIGFIFINLPSWAGSYEDYFKAIQFDDVRTVQALLQRGFDPNTVNPAGHAGLMLAVREPSPKVTQLLLSWPKIKVEVRNDKDESVLMLAALKGYLPLVKQLVENDADVNKPGWTPLHYAASTGQVAVIEFLLDNSAYIDAESPNGSTPLMMAAMYGSPEAVKHLIQAGADLQIKNGANMTALDFAQRGSRPNNIELMQEGLRREAERDARKKAAAAASSQTSPAQAAPSAAR